MGLGELADQCLDVGLRWSKFVRIWFGGLFPALLRASLAPLHALAFLLPEVVVLRAESPVLGLKVCWTHGYFSHVEVGTVVSLLSHFIGFNEVNRSLVAGDRLD